MPDLQYNPKVLRYFAHPKNMGVVKDANTSAMVGNPVCGDVMRLTLKIVKNKAGQEIIKDIKFQTLGCGAAIATSSIATELVKGKTLTEAAKLTDQDIIRELGGLPSAKHHCSILANQALKEAIKKYKISKH